MTGTVGNRPEQREYGRFPETIPYKQRIHGWETHGYAVKSVFTQSVCEVGKHDFLKYSGFGKTMGFVYWIIGILVY